jgi:Tfp pilus assembly protein PilO
MSRIRKWSLLTSVAALLVLVAGWFLLVRPMRSSASDLRDQAKTQQSSNASLQQRIQMLRAQAKDLPAVRAKLAASKTKIPEDPALPSLIRTLSTTADDAGVDLVSIAPSDPSALSTSQSSQPSSSSPSPSPSPSSSSSESSSSSASGGDSGAAPTTSSTPQSQLIQIPLSVQVKGTYATLEQFFAGTEDMKRALVVTGFSLTPGGKGDSDSGSASNADAKSGSGQLTAQLTARAFLSPKSKS